MPTRGLSRSVAVIGPPAAVPAPGNGSGPARPHASAGPAGVALTDGHSQLAAVTARLQHIGSTATGANLRAAADLLIDDPERVSVPSELDRAVSGPARAEDTVLRRGMAIFLHDNKSPGPQD
jgi:hypothetical protein